MPAARTAQMDPARVREIRNHCAEVEVALFHKQYYRAGHLSKDGVIGGVVRQEWPH